MTVKSGTSLAVHPKTQRISCNNTNNKLRTDYRKIFIWLPCTWISSVRTTSHCVFVRQLILKSLLFSWLLNDHSLCLSSSTWGTFIMLRQWLLVSHFNSFCLEVSITLGDHSWYNNSLIWSPERKRHKDKNRRVGKGKGGHVPFENDKDPKWKVSNKFLLLWALPKYFPVPLSRTKTKHQPICSSC